MNNPPSAGRDNSFWHSLFSADSIAVIGANNDAGSWGFDAMRTALASSRAEPKRRVYPVNPNLKEIMGCPAYGTILDIPDPVELAIIVVRADIVPAILRQCVRKKVKAAVIISAGFGEVDEDGARREAELVKIAHEGGMRFVGPNCIGHADVHTLVASAGIAGRGVHPGPLALLSQSGTLGASIMGNALRSGIGLSKFVSTGNEASLRMEDYLEYLAQDEKTRIIGLYIEGLRDGRRFFKLAREITLKKPIIAIKTGITAEAGKAAKSHTGALSGSDIIYNAAFRQSGVIRADDETELCDIAVALLNQPLPPGDRVGILTMGGGFGVITAEACEKEGLKIASLEPQTIEKMNAVLPPRWSHSNPVDLVGVRSAGEGQVNSTCLRLLIEDNNVDCIISLVPPGGYLHAFTGVFSPERFREIQEENQKGIIYFNQLARERGKTLFVVSRFTPRIDDNAEGRPPGMPREQIPEFANHRRAARILRHLLWYRQYLDHRKS